MNNTGWICPRCQSVYAPFIPECSWCKFKGPDIVSGIPFYSPISHFSINQNTFKPIDPSKIHEKKPSEVTLK